MYLYFDKTGVLKTKIDHGEVARQGNDLSVSVCLDADFFTNFATLYSGVSSDPSNWGVTVEVQNSTTNVVLASSVLLSAFELTQFKKIYDGEVTYNLINDEFYYIASGTIPGSYSTNYGTSLRLSFTLYDVSQVVGAVVDSSDLAGLEGYDNYLASAVISVEKTYNVQSHNISSTAYQQLADVISALNVRVALIEGEYIRCVDSLPTGDDYHAGYVYLLLENDDDNDFKKGDIVLATDNNDVYELLINSATTINELLSDINDNIGVIEDDLERVKQDYVINISKTDDNKKILITQVINGVEQTQFEFQGGEDVDQTVIQDSTRPVSGGAVYEELQTKINKNALADAFSASNSYTVGDLVIYNDKIYKCIVAHNGDWNSADFEESNLQSLTTSLDRADIPENDLEDFIGFDSNGLLAREPKLLELENSEYLTTIILTALNNSIVVIEGTYSIDEEEINIQTGGGRL